jgi:hypothetical protein
LQRGVPPKRRKRSAPTARLNSSIVSPTRCVDREHQVHACVPEHAGPPFACRYRRQGDV